MSEQKFTPMEADGSVVLLAGRAGGFDLRGCPHPESLAEFIVRACNAHDDLVKALEPFYCYIKSPTMPIHAVIRPEEWDAVVSAYERAKAGAA